MRPFLWYRHCYRHYHIRFCRQVMSLLRQTTTPLTIMHPPKPPSWRDFVASDVNNKTQTSLASVSTDTPSPVCRLLDTKSTTLLHDINELSKVNVSASVSVTKLTKVGRRPRAKIHRTRSEHVILTDELPPNGLESTPKDVTVVKKQPNPEPSEGCASSTSTEITRRCQSWLASIEACEPLDEVSYTAGVSGTSSSAATVTHSSEENENLSSDGKVREEIQYHNSDSDTFSVPLHTFGEDVDVEIPEEMFRWSDGRRASSLCSRDDVVSPLTIETTGVVNRETSAKVTKCSLNRSESQRNAFVPIDKQFLSEKSKSRLEFVNVHGSDDKDSFREENKKNSTKLCCDICITFCYRRKEVQSDT